MAGWKTPANIGEAELAAYTLWYKTSDAPDLQAPLQDAPENGWISLRPGIEESHAEITGLTNGTVYDVRIRAHYLVEASSSGSTDSPWSATVSATPQEDIIWAAILTVDEDYDGSFGCQDSALTASGMEECATALTGDEFDFEDTTYRWTSLVDLNEPWEHDVFGFDTAVPADSGLRSGRLEVGSDSVSLDDSSRVRWMTDDTGFTVVGPAAKGPNWFTVEGQKVPLSLRATPQQPDDASNDGESAPAPGDDDNGINDGPTTAASTQESAPVPVVTFGHQETGEGEYWVSVNEGDELTVTLIFTPALTKDTSIRWYTAWHHGGEHANGAEHYGSEESDWLRLRSDYVQPDRPAERDIALTAGMTSATFAVQTVEDSEVEGNEAFHLHLCGRRRAANGRSPHRSPTRAPRDHRSARSHQE